MLSLSECFRVEPLGETQQQQQTRAQVLNANVNSGNTWMNLAAYAIEKLLWYRTKECWELGALSVLRSQQSLDIDGAHCYGEWNIKYHNKWSDGTIPGWIKPLLPLGIPWSKSLGASWDKTNNVRGIWEYGDNINEAITVICAVPWLSTLEILMMLIIIQTQSGSGHFWWPEGASIIWWEILWFWSCSLHLCHGRGCQKPPLVWLLLVIWDQRSYHPGTHLKTHIWLGSMANQEIQPSGSILWQRTTGAEQNTRKSVFSSFTRGNETAGASDLNAI